MPEPVSEFVPASRAAHDCGNESLRSATSRNNRWRVLARPDDFDGKRTASSWSLLTFFAHHVADRHNQLESFRIVPELPAQGRDMNVNGAVEHSCFGERQKVYKSLDFPHTRFTQRDFNRVVAASQSDSVNNSNDGSPPESVSFLRRLFYGFSNNAVSKRACSMTSTRLSRKRKKE